MARGKFNEGQYGLQPWLANLIMGLLELAMLCFWVKVCVLPIMTQLVQIAQNYDMVSLVKWEPGNINAVLAGLFLFWNILVWTIKPLRTRFNYRETWLNLVFIAWLLIDMIM